MQIRFGKKVTEREEGLLTNIYISRLSKEYDFFPQTFILPNDSRTLRQEFERLGGKQKWIIKPVRKGRETGGTLEVSTFMFI